jgi:hypothetical protein
VGCTNSVRLESVDPEDRERCERVRVQPLVDDEGEQEHGRASTCRTCSATRSCRPAPPTCPPRPASRSPPGSPHNSSPASARAPSSSPERRSRPAQSTGCRAFRCALVNTSTWVGGALGLAIFSVFATSRTNHLLAHSVAPPNALTAGFHRALVACSIFLIAAAAIRASGDPTPAANRTPPGTRGRARCRDHLTTNGRASSASQRRGPPDPGVTLERPVNRRCVCRGLTRSARPRSRDLRRVRPARRSCRFAARSYLCTHRDAARRHPTTADRRPDPTSFDWARQPFEGPLAPRSHCCCRCWKPSRGKSCKSHLSCDGACGIRTRGLRLANPPDSPTPPDTDLQNRHD